MFTIAECRAIAKIKIALSKRDSVHRAKHTNAAEAWLILAGKLEDPKEQSVFLDFGRLANIKGL